MADPILKFFTTAGATIDGTTFGTVAAGDESAEATLNLWNNKDGATVVDDAEDVRISVLDQLGLKTSRAVVEGYVLARSAGITFNPINLDEFFDDNQAVFTPLTSVSELLIGNIPNDSGRTIKFKVKVPVDAPTAGLTIQFVAGHGSNVTPLPFFFDRAFGSGVVQEELPHIFPSVLLRLISTYSIVALSGGAYTGPTIVNKDYILKVVTAGTSGDMQYQTSDDNEASFSSTTNSVLNQFTNVLTSGDVDEGVDVGFPGGLRFEVDDKWRISVETRPFQLKPGLSTSLEGNVGAGTAFVNNNRVIHKHASLVQNLIASTRNFLFLGVDGTFTLKTADATPQAGKVTMGWFDTDANGVTAAEERFPLITMGLELFDDFTPIFDRIAGLTWVFFQGRYRKFDEIILLPAADLIGSLTLSPGVTNFVQIDAKGEVMVAGSSYLPDHIPLFRVATGPQFVEAFVDDRAEVGVASLQALASFTTATVNVGASVSFDFTSFNNRALIRKLTVTPTSGGAGATVTFYEKDTHQEVDKEYQAGNIPDPFTDNFFWFHHDRDGTKELHGILDNHTGVTQTFTLDFEFERFA